MKELLRVVLVLGLFLLMANVVCVVSKAIVVDPLFKGLGMDNPLDKFVHTFQELVAMPRELAMWLNNLIGGM